MDQHTYLSPFALRCECVKQWNTVYSHKTEAKLHSYSSMLTLYLSIRHPTKIICVLSAVFEIKYSIQVNIQVIRKNYGIT